LPDTPQTQYGEESYDLLARTVSQRVAADTASSPLRIAHAVHQSHRWRAEWRRKLPIALAAAALLTTGFVAAGTEPAGAVVHCSYVGYPANCVARPGVVLRTRPVARAIATPGVGRVGTPMDRGGPVNRAGRR
jgi:hypothetical protein